MAHGLNPALDGDLAARLEHEAVEDALRGRLTDDDCAGVRRRLKPRRDIRGVAERDRLGARRPDHADGRLARVDADARVEVGDAPGRLHLACVVADEVEDAQRSTRRALGVVLVRDGDPEEDGDAVAHVRLHLASVLLDRVAHSRDAFAHDDLDLVGREALAERRRADDVGEQRGHGPELVGESGSCARAWRTECLSTRLRRRRARRRGLRLRRAFVSRGRARRGCEPGLLLHRRGGSRHRRRRLGGLLRGSLLVRASRRSLRVERGQRSARQHRPAAPLRLDLDLDRRLADGYDVAGLQPARLADPLAVDPRAVERAEILDLEAVLHGADRCVPARDERIIDRDVGIRPSEQKLGLDLELLPGERAGLQSQRRHS